MNIHKIENGYLIYTSSRDFKKRTKTRFYKTIEEVNKAVTKYFEEKE